MKRNYYMVAVVFLTFFVISLITNILGPLIPDIGKSFSLSKTLMGFLPFSFFLAYGVMSIPAGLLVEIYREKLTMSLSFVLILLSSLIFVLFPDYIVYTFSLFMIGAGMAVLQVAINPLLRVSGGEEHFAFNSVMAQLIFGGASFISPRIYTSLVQNLQEMHLDSGALIQLLSKVVPQDLPWVSLYWVFILVVVLMLVIILVSRFPRVERAEDERAGAWGTYKVLFKIPIVNLYFLGILCYVGSEQGVANWMSKFLEIYHGYDPQVAGAAAVSWFWGLMTAGCVLGLLLLKLFDSRYVLIGSATTTLIALTVALFGSGEIARIAFPSIGFFISVMWSIIFSLALNSVKKYHGAFSGILCTGIVGGGLISLIVGWLGDLIGLRFGMFFLYLTVGYILSIGIWARPLITNKTILGKARE